MAARTPSTPKQRRQDDVRYCDRCGISFVWSVEEQRALQSDSEAGESAPHHCPACRTLLPRPGRERALVKWYSMRKRYGFLVRRDQPELFVPAASLEGTRLLQPGDLVEFELGANEQGPIALHVHLLAPAAALDVPLDDVAQFTIRRNPAARKGLRLG